MKIRLRMSLILVIVGVIVYINETGHTNGFYKHAHTLFLFGLAHLGTQQLIGSLDSKKLGCGHHLIANVLVRVPPQG